MPHLIDELIAAVEARRAAVVRTSEARRRLRQCRHELRLRRAELTRLILELQSGAPATLRVPADVPAGAVLGDPSSQPEGNGRRPPK